LLIPLRNRLLSELRPLSLLFTGHLLLLVEILIVVIFIRVPDNLVVIECAILIDIDIALLLLLEELILLSFFLFIIVFFFVIIRLINFNT